MINFFFKNKHNNTSIRSDFGFLHNTIYYIRYDRIYSDPHNRVKAIYEVYIGNLP